MIALFRVTAMLVTVALVAAGQKPLTKEQKIARILDLTNSNGVVETVASQMQQMMNPLATTPQQKARTKDAVDKIIKLVRERVDKLRPQMAKIYSDTFTEEEIDGMLAFYETPAGKASLEKLPQVNAKMSGLIQAELNALGPEINKIAEDALKK